MIRQLILACLAAGVGIDSYAQTPAITSAIGGSPSSLGFSQTTLIGFNFSPSIPIEVSAIGVFDLFGDGLATDMTTGLFRRETQTVLPGFDVATGVEIARVVAPAGTDAELIGSYRYIELSTPVLLEPDNIYQVSTAYFSSGSEGMRSGATLQFDPLLLNVSSRAVQSNSFTDVRFIGSAFGGSPVGPSFLFHAVPEPASGIAMLMFVSMLPSFWRFR